MLRELLWLWDARLNYQRGLATGLAGLFGIASVILCVAYWDYIYNVLNFIGIVGLVEKAGLVNEEWTPVLIVVGIIYLFLCITIIFLVGLGIFLLLTMLVNNLDNGKHTWLSTMILLPIALPFLLLFELVMFLRGPKKYWIDKLDQRKEYKKKLSYIQNQKEVYVKRNVLKFFTAEEARDFLNRIYMVGDKDFLLGYVAKDDSLYLLIPSPLSFKESSFDSLSGWGANATSKHYYYGNRIVEDDIKEVFKLTGYRLSFKEEGNDKLSISQKPTRIDFQDFTYIVKKDESVEVEFAHLIDWLSESSDRRNELERESLVYLKEYDELVKHITGEKELNYTEKDPIEVLNMYKAANHVIASLVYNDLPTHLVRNGMSEV